MQIRARLQIILGCTTCQYGQQNRGQRASCINPQRERHHPFQRALRPPLSAQAPVQRRCSANASAVPTYVSVYVIVGGRRRAGAGRRLYAAQASGWGSTIVGSVCFSRASSRIAAESHVAKRCDKVGVEVTERPSAPAIDRIVVWRCSAALHLPPGVLLPLDSFALGGDSRLPAVHTSRCLAPSSWNCKP